MRSLTTGQHNVAVGSQASMDITTASGNVAIGHNSQANVTTGSSNVSVGKNTLDDLTTGNNNTAVGHDTADTLTTGGGNTLLGYNAEPSSATVDNEFTLGGSNVTSLRCNDTSISSLSDRRDKTDIVDLKIGLDFINSLIPRQFKWQTRHGNIKDGLVRAGFIAQELQEAQKIAIFLI